MTTLVARDIEEPAVLRIAAAVARIDRVCRVVLHHNAGEGDAILTSGGSVVFHDDGLPEERIGTVRHLLESGAFSQINTGAAELLYGIVSILADAQGRRVLDLYAGSGGISLRLGRDGAAAVVGVEQRPEAVDAARKACALNGLEDTVRFEVGKVESHMSGEFDVVVLNPPRKGASSEVLERVVRSRPQQVVYVSCNPTSLARDVARLGERVRLEIGRIVPVDLFPQTRHIETVLELRVG